MDSEVEDLLEDGWKPRIKTVKGRKYITVRKAGKERSLGPYTEELWGRMSKMVEVKPELNLEEWNLLRSILVRFDDTIDELKTELKTIRVRSEAVDDQLQFAELKATRCPAIRDWYGQRFCSEYAWTRKPSKIMKMFPEVTFKRNKMDSRSNKWRFKPHQDICGGCLKFLEPTFEVVSLDRDVSKLRTTVDHMPIANLYRDFKCAKCGSIHLMAVKIKCTSCNAETWWGYRPN